MSFPTTIDDFFTKTSIPSLTALATNHLGLSNATVEAHLYKMLLYEPGGHFKKPDVAFQYYDGETQKFECLFFFKACLEQWFSKFQCKEDTEEDILF